MSPVIAGVIVVALLVIVGVLALAEGVLVHLSLARAATLVDETAGDGASLPQLIEARESHLGAVVGLRIMAQVAVVGTVVFTLRDYEVGAVRWLVSGGAMAVVFGMIEIVAKVQAVARTPWSARVAAPVIRTVGRIPLARFGGGLIGRLLRRGSDGDDVEDEPAVSEEELLAMAEVAADAEVIETSERALIESIIEFGDTIVREVMVPRPDMVTVGADHVVREVMEVIIHHGYSRIPVVGDGIDDVVGIAYAKDLMRAERDGSGASPCGRFLRDARFVPEQQRVSALLPEMQANQFHMAVVIDEYGGVAGLVTLEDLIEELVGEIVDEFDVEDPMAEPLPGGAYRVNARMPLDEVNDLIDAELPEGDWDTVGGLLFGTLGHVPTRGESVEIGDHRLTVDRVQGRRIGAVRIDVLAPPRGLLSSADPERSESR